MAEKFSSKDPSMAAILECAVCHEEVKLPYSLSCLHAFCKSCLMAVPQGEKDGNKGWFCPRCRSFSKQEEFKHNFFIDELLEVLSMKEVKVTCQQCDTEVNVSWRCVDCKFTLCNNCQLGHLKIPALRFHRIVPLTEETESILDKLVFCGLHPDKTIEFNCKVCEKPICITCKVTDHDVHRTETVDKALERLLPEIESNTKGIDDNIQILAAQVQAIESKIESVKEAYTSCRMGMDSRLELMTYTIKAIRAKQETLITEQESIALATLQKSKGSLDNQLSEANQVTNVVKTCTSKAKHATLLTELQSHLFEKVKTQNNIKIETVNIKLPVAKFDFNQDNSEEELSQIFGLPEVKCETNVVFTDGTIESEDKYTDNGDELQYTDENITSAEQNMHHDIMLRNTDGTTHSIVENKDVIEDVLQNTVVAMDIEDEPMCDNFASIFKNPVKKDKEVALLDSWHNRISYIDNKIVAPAAEKCKIEIFNVDASLDKVIDTKDKRINVVKKAYNSDLIAAGDDLFITNSEFSTWRQEAEGQFSDVIIHENRFSALRFDDPCVMTFSLESTAGEGAQADNTEWKIITTFHIDKNKEIDDNSTLGICGDHYFITSTLNKAIYTYSFNGTLVSTDTKSLDWNPFICGRDRRGKLLVGNFNHGTLHVLDSVSGEMTQVQDIGVKLDLIRDLVIDDDQNVWCLQGNEPYHLIKYTPK